MITLKETACKCACGLNVTSEFLFKLNEIRSAYGKPIIVLSGARCQAHNKSIGGALKSAHIEGVAADLMRSSALRSFLEANLDRFNVYLEAPSHTGNDDNGWLHVTTRSPGTGKRTFMP
jgi:hypothetical protein